MYYIFSLEHNLPDNLFSSPKAACGYMSAFTADTTTVEENGNEAVVSAPAPTNNLMASSSTLDMASLKSCYFQVPRYLFLHISFFRKMQNQKYLYTKYPMQYFPLKDYNQLITLNRFASNHGAIEM